MNKECIKCKEILSIDNFYKNSRSSDGLDCYCKKCKIINGKLRYINNKEKIQAYAREYSKTYIIKQGPKRKYKRNAPFSIEERLRRNASNKKWAENNRLYHNDRRKVDPMFRMSGNLRKRTLAAFKSKSWHKNSGTKKLIGCDWNMAHDYLEHKFTEGMSWNNYGEWHIDHIIPLCSANTEEELIKLCHYTNLQPLWAADNLRKHSKII